MDIRRGAAEVHRETVAELPRVGEATRAAMLTLPPDRVTHRRLVEEVEALRLLEAGAAAVGARTGPLRVAYWNVQRFHHFDACCALIRKMAPDILLLGELDIGMARTDQRHCLREAAAALRANYVFGTEFLELGLGDEKERRRYAGSRNESGFHGNGILSRLRLESPALIRLETDGDWFDGGHGERRVGGRCAVAASIAMGAKRIVFVSIHLESHSGPALRAEQLRRLFDAVDQFAPGQPVVIGGDLNTSTFTRTTTARKLSAEAAVREDPRRLVDPERYEPLFEIAGTRGYEWKAANAFGPTERAPAAEAAILGHIDWFFVRGLRVSESAIVPAIDERGNIISDHEMIMTTVAE
ncbi:MAG TPA: endonuclease/exonuclease/phosphatase family protein [Candidatus Angelobacter sp.]|nr:endonuclease/exonuclease/phosphatase family protein [Candidatus Angelobacter sp.]